MEFFSILIGFWTKNPIFIAVNLYEFDKSAEYASMGSTWDAIFLEHICFFSFFFDLWVHNSQTSYKIFEKLCPICILRFRKNIWTKKTVYEKKWFPIMIFGTWAENLWTLVEQFMRGCRSCILRFQSCILRFSNLVESQIYFFTFLGFWGHNYKMLVKTFRKDCANRLLRAQEKFLTKADVIEKNIVFYQFRTVIEKF